MPFHYITQTTFRDEYELRRNAIISILTLTVHLSNRMKFIHLFTVRYIFKRTAEVHFSFQVKYSHQQAYSPFKNTDRGSFFAVF